MDAYKSKYTGEQIDAAVKSVSAGGGCLSY